MVRSAPTAQELTDFEGGLPEGWFTFFGGSTVDTTTEGVADSDALALPGQSGDNEILNNTYNIIDFGDFGQGGGGIYSGDGATLTLLDSSVVDNSANWSGGGVFSFFNTTTTIVRSTITGNLSNDVGGGLRLLGNAEIINSTISGNESTSWYGGALFITDGVVNMTNSTVADNTSPEAGPADVFVGTFTEASATLNMVNSIVSSGQEACFLAPFGSGAVAIVSDHNNLFTDATCFNGSSDQVVADALLGGLADNGGPTRTHLLQAGSAAIDTADTAACPDTDQRGVTRPQGAGCDVGAVELEP